MMERRTVDRVGIVGGGIAGLAAARVLADTGCTVTVHDKGRGPGGRASTRRRDAHRFDHGAQYFTARDARFRAAVETWRRDGVVAEWTARVAAADAPGVLRATARAEPRYVGVPGMGAVARHLVAELGDRATVRFDARVARVERASTGWMVCDTGDASGEAYDALVVCTPAPQALELLDGRTTLVDTLRRATMTPCWSAMCAFEEPLVVDADALFVNVADQPLAWASRDSSKPGRPAGERWVLHATPAWTREHVDAVPERVATALVGALAAAVGRPLPAPTFADAHRWRYAQGALDPAPGALVDAAGTLAVAGDWCHGGRIEGAWLSGTQAAERLLEGWEGPRR
jgi:hypothetical protein